MLKTEFRELAEEYLRLGGKRQSKIDDNITSMRHWEGDPPEAARFWNAKIAPLEREAQEEVIFFLPDINQP